MHFQIVTLFPEFFASPLQTGLLGRARLNSLLDFSFYNPRDYADNRHRHVDDRPFGGGPGMVLQIGPLAKALKSMFATGPILLMSAAGASLDGELAANLASYERLTLVCGRYEGVDARLEAIFPISTVRVGDAILNGGETAALALIEAVARFLPGFLGKEESRAEESLANGLLEYPQYTRPAAYEGVACPEILLGGNHAAIRAWRRKQALRATLERRPRLLAQAPLERDDAEYLAGLPRLRLGRQISFCLCHYPVKLEDGRVGASSLTNIDIHDIARISQAYGMGPFFVLSPLDDQLELLRKIVSHWRDGPAARSRPDRAGALSLVRYARDFVDLEEQARQWYGTSPRYIISSAAWPRKKTSRPLAWGEIRKMAASGPLVICLGTAKGLDMRSLGLQYESSRPIRFLDANHLSVRAAAAIMADRLLGDFD